MEQVKRNNYIDALRGLAMIMVVFEHVRLFCFGLSPASSPFGIFIVNCQMPIFFFISGLLAYKPQDSWTGKVIMKKFYNKALQLLIPTFVFWGAIQYLELFPNWRFPGGYWFTEALFIIFGIYYLIAFCCRRLNSNIETAILIVVGLGLYISSYRLFQIDLLRMFVMHDVGSYFIFFVVGILSKKYGKKFNILLHIQSIIALSVVVPLISLMILNGPSHPEISGGKSEIIRLINGCCITFGLFYAFNCKSGYWQLEGGGKFNKIILTIGRRTMEIYMLHFLFLPKISSIIVIFKQPNLLIDYGLTSIVTILVISCVFLVSQFLRISPQVTKILFGTNL